jgi:hypothetical protein
MRKVELRPVDSRAGKFFRGRVAVEPDDGHLEFFLKMSGGYEWLSLASTLKQAVTAPHAFLCKNPATSKNLARDSP